MPWRTQRMQNRLYCLSGTKLEYISIPGNQADYSERLLLRNILSPSTKKEAHKSASLRLPPLYIFFCPVTFQKYSGYTNFAIYSAASAIW